MRAVRYKCIHVKRQESKGRLDSRKSIQVQSISSRDLLGGVTLALHFDRSSGQMRSLLSTIHTVVVACQRLTMLLEIV